MEPRKKKLLIWSHPLDREGGGERDLRLFLERLKEAGTYELFGILPDGNARVCLAAYFVKEATCRQAIFPLRWQPLRAYVAYALFSIRQVLQIRAFLSSLNVDAVVFFSSLLVTPWLYTSLTKKTKRILFVREVITPRWVRKVLFRFLFKNAATIVAVSDFLKTDIRELCHHPDVETVYSLPQLPSRRSPGRMATREPGFQVAIVGPISAVKGHDLLMLALGRMDLPGEPIIVHVVGERPLYGAHRRFLRNFDRLVREMPATITIRFHGTLPHGELIDLLGAIDVLVIPSRAEGLSVTLLESLLLKTPVIAARIGEMQRILADERQGLLFAAEDVGDLAAKIETLVKNRKMLEGMRARSGRLPAFLGNAEANWQKLEAVLQRACQREHVNREEAVN